MNTMKQLTSSSTSESVSGFNGWLGSVTHRKRSRLYFSSSNFRSHQSFSRGLKLKNLGEIEEKIMWTTRGSAVFWLGIFLSAMVGAL